ncbi:coatomer subunit gamma (coPG) [Vairimorpha necatrix]|uniref:Coatomer subunit gamma (CoPG) n=1 Tax=Vairimorpha necatrix TaxID=6039 RepID=A0AAX4JGE8_9MICR
MNSFFTKESENLILQDISEKFNSSTLNTRNCIKSINAFLYFLQSNKLDQDTINSILIFLLRSFQSKEQYLKHVVYSVLIELSKYTDQGFIGINIILKDFTTSKYKSKILKSLFCIIPEEMINDFTKYLKESFISSDEKLVNSSVLVSYLLINKNFIKSKDLFKNLKITDDIYGYHKLALLNLSNKINNDHFNYKNEAGIMSVRLAVKYKKFEKFKNFLNLRISDTIIFFEACNQMTEIREENSLQFITLICQGLKNFLKNGNFYEKFSSIKILSKLSTKFPSKIGILNKEIEELLQDSSKSLSMLAISTLLKTGTEETIDRLIKYLPDFMSEMDDNHKKVGLNALYILTLKNTKKINIFLDFVKTCFLEKGSLSFKLYIVNLLRKLLNNSDSTLIDNILDIYVNYLEDSEYYEVSAEILGIMSREIYKSKNSKKYLLHVYNRLILEDNKYKNCVLQTIYDLSNKINLDESVFYDCEDEVLKKFYINNKQQNVNTSENFYDSENLKILLGDLNDKVQEYLKDYKIEENIIKEDTVKENIKESREILLNKETDEILIKLVKKISGEKINLEYKIQNNHEDLEIKNGILSVKINGEIEKLSFKNLKPGNTKILNLEIKSELDLSIFGNLDYEICIVDDYSETENESISLVPYQITLFDLMINKNTEKGEYNKIIKINLKNDLVGGSKKILDLINLKVVSQNNLKNKNQIHFSGEYENKGCYIECDIEYDRICRISIEIWNDSEELLEKIMKYFE